jgi:hypothetical protein
MNRPVNSTTRIHPDQRVAIGYEEPCDNKTVGTKPREYVVNGVWTCMPCEHWRIFDKLRLALTSHFTRDKEIRDEFLRAYFGLV